MPYATPPKELANHEPTGSAKYLPKPPEAVPLNHQAASHERNNPAQLVISSDRSGWMRPRTQ